MRGPLARSRSKEGRSRPLPGRWINAGYHYLEVKYLLFDTHQTVALDIVRWPKSTPIHTLERCMRCKPCSEQHGYPFKRSHLIALRPTKISATIHMVARVAALGSNQSACPHAGFLRPGIIALDLADEETALRMARKIAAATGRAVTLRNADMIAIATIPAVTRQ
jgi:hypothetical protein